MRIFELQGYKNNPDYQAIKDAKRLFDIEKYLLNRGYVNCEKDFAHGANSLVFSHPEKPYVVKIIENDPAYAAFVHLVQTTPRVYFPRLYGKLVKLDKKRSIIRIEQLHTCDYDLGQKFLKEWQTLYSNPNTKSSKFPWINEAFHLIIGHLPPDAVDDMRPNNIMQRRNGELVIIDPYIS